jgi:protein ImuB
MSAFSVNRRRILSLRLPRLPIDRLKRQLLRNVAPADAADNLQAVTRLNSTIPWVVVAKQHQALKITALDDVAVECGLEPGLPLADARAMCPDLQVCDADEVADRHVLNAIADWCDRFTPLVTLDPPHGLFLDITGCAHLFGGEAGVMQTICRALHRQGFVVNAAIASTPGCARTVALGMKGQVVPPGAEIATVSSLPVFTLGADDAITYGLRRAGLKTIGDVVARAPHEVASRFGAAFMARLQQALGQADAPISPRKPPPDYLAEKNFPEPVASDHVIMTSLDGLAVLLVATMERHGKGARRLEASFFRTDGVVKLIEVEAGRPVTQTMTIARLFREKLAALADPLDPGFGFDLIRLSASHVESVIQEQRNLDAHAQDDDDVVALIDRMSARIGSRRIVVHVPRDTHIPEFAEIAILAQHHWAMAAHVQWPPRILSEPPLRPLRLFDRPEPIDVVAEVPDGPPARFKWRRVFHLVARVEGPERISMEWWRPHGTMLTRDYFRVEDGEGLRFWLYRDGLYGAELRDEQGRSKSPNWFMHGLFA